MRRISVGGMSRTPKAAQAKKVPPPAVPESAFRNSGSSFGSAGYSSAGEDIFHHERDNFELTDCGGNYIGPSKSPAGTFSYPAFTFPGPGQGNQVCPKSGYYHHQLSLQEDQGIDMTQSPGRDSPGSSGSGSRHSTVSLDSGRASCALSHYHRTSLSSSSVGSGESSAPARVERLLMQGVSDQDILHSWLTDIHFEEYFPLFIKAGYDMHTISRMTPEDLTAIGIKKPNHRKKLKAEIAQLNISDGLPDYIPGSLSEWLRLLRLEEYGASLRSQGYVTVEDTTQITWEDLEDIGIVKLGHQKRIMLAIKRIQDLRAGKIFPPTPFIPIQIRGGRGKSLESLEGEPFGRSGPMTSFTTFTGEWGRRCYEDGDITPTNKCNTTILLHQGGGTLPRPRALLKPRPQAKIAPTLCIHQHEVKQEEDPRMSPVIIRSSDCSSVTVVADLHHPKHHYNGSDASFKSSSSTESDSLPFANENAGTIKQRMVRNAGDFMGQMRAQSNSECSILTARKGGQESGDVLDDIGNMLANLTDELDAMLEEEKRQGLIDD